MQRTLQKLNKTGQPVTATPSSSLTGMMMPRGAMATTNPFTGNITYNPSAMSQSDVEPTITHELVHSQQAQNTPWWRTVANLFTPDVKVPQGIRPGSILDNPYYWRPEEMEAFQAERNRYGSQPNYTDPVLGTTDIPLPSPRSKKIDTGPSFLKK